MEASARMHWGIICSIDDSAPTKQFIEFGSWMVKQLEESASKLHLGHRFTDQCTFALRAEPGSAESSKAVYKSIAERYPHVTYAIHILPVKDSIEYEVLKEVTSQGALIGQGVLAENALTRFKSYELDEVMANMNQWIGRRLAQITARRTEEANRISQSLAKQMHKELHQFPRQSQSQARSPAQIKPIMPPPPPIITKFQPNQTIRKDKYRLTMASDRDRGAVGASSGAFGGSMGSGRFQTGANTIPIGRRVGGGNTTTNKQGATTTIATSAFSHSAFGGGSGIDIRAAADGGGRQPVMNQQQWIGNDYELPVGVVLHSIGNSFRSRSNQVQYAQFRPPSMASSEQGGLEGGKQPKYEHQQPAKPQQLLNIDGKEREKEVIVGGYPYSFNKFQIAALFPDFRPVNVQYMAAGEAHVQFANKYHAAQVIASYNERHYPDENFCLKVISADFQNEPAKQVEAMRAKMAGLLLRVSTEKAAARTSKGAKSAASKGGKENA